MTVILDIAYYGKPFCGFARQTDELTVQGNIEEVLLKIFGKTIETTCAGRTDSGVHAKHQFVSFNLNEQEENKFSEHKLMGSIESLTHDDIHINSVKFTNEEFSARFDAKLRKYSYFICNQKNPALIMRNFSWHVSKDLDIDSMKKASQFLIGEHDFKSFCVAASAKDKTTMRNISNIEFIEHNIFGDNVIEICVDGNAFLHSMVRTIVGTLVKIGLGNRDFEWMQEVLDAKDRQAAGECAPAEGLVLMDVIY